jgi:hypothetical protein
MPDMPSLAGETLANQLLIALPTLAESHSHAAWR